MDCLAINAGFHQMWQGLLDSQFSGTALFRLSIHHFCKFAPVLRPFFLRLDFSRFFSLKRGVHDLVTSFGVLLSYLLLQSRRNPNWRGRRRGRNARWCATTTAWSRQQRECGKSWEGKLFMLFFIFITYTPSFFAEKFGVASSSSQWKANSSKGLATQLCAYLGVISQLHFCQNDQGLSRVAVVTQCGTWMMPLSFD